MQTNPYSIYDYVLVDFLEVGDIIRWDGEVYTVKQLDGVSNGFIIHAVDEMEEDVEIIIPDNAIIPLLEEE